MTSMGRFFVTVDAQKQQIDLRLSISRDDVGVFFKMDTNKDRRIDKEELKALRGTAAAHFAERLLVSNNGLLCKVVKQHFLPKRERLQRRRLVFAQRIRCKQPFKLLLFQNTVMFDDVGGYQHIARIRVGKKVYAPYFSRMSPRYTVELVVPRLQVKSAQTSTASTELRSRGEGWLATLIRYVFKGGWHIVIGLDHLAFIFCLLLIARDLRHLIWVITSFTIGHSITLILCVMDVVFLPVKPIEALIALTIAYVGVENIMMRKQEKPPRFRLLLTTAFGMIHGFGFSYILKELNLPKDALVPSLLGFNIGIELAQCGIVLMVYPLLYQWMQKEWYERVILWASIGTTCVAMYWFITRAFF